MLSSELCMETQQFTENTFASDSRNWILFSILWWKMKAWLLTRLFAL